MKRFLGFALALGGCAMTRQICPVLDPMPPLTRSQDPTDDVGHVPVCVRTPTPRAKGPSGKNSLWQSGASAFFQDQRAQRVGDIFTVTVDLNTSGTVKEETKTASSHKQKINNLKLFGWDKSPTKQKEGDDEKRKFNFGEGLGLDSSPESTSNGNYNMSQTVKCAVPVMVTQVLENGNLVIMGRQEVRVHRQVREIVLMGIVRPEDIDSTNKIRWDQVAQGRLSYHGRGDLQDLQTVPWGYQAVRAFSPF